jgi:hypothetical protein
MKKSDHPSYHSWSNMRQRCTNPSATGYARYGGRGIKVCDRWADDFWTFAADMGPKPPGYTLERKDNNADYEPSNCRWASRKEQSRNVERNLRVVIDGQEYLACQLEEQSRWSRKSIATRAKAGMSLEEVLFGPKMLPSNRFEAREKAWAKRRAQTHCKRGHEFTPENTVIDKRGSRSCRECGRAKSRVQNAALRAKRAALICDG